MQGWLIVRPTASYSWLTDGCDKGGIGVYATLYNRLCGWLLVATGALGLFFGQLGDYARFTTAESCGHLGLGFLSLLAARSGRRRYAASGALGVGLSLFFWGISGLTWPNTPWWTSEPVDNALRLVAGIWGMYIAVQEVQDWRRNL